VTTQQVQAASVIIFDDSDRVLLIKRGHEPAKGLWSLPGGGVMAGETPAQAAQREAREETGLLVTVGEEIFQVVVPLAPSVEYAIHGFLATIEGGVLEAGDDAEEAAFVSGQDYHFLATTPRLTELLHRAGWSGASGDGAD
jgi:acetyl-CoA carboxylase carboxyl transferase subunit beta